MKSSAKAKLETYRATFFLVGLVLALFAALTTLEYKVTDKTASISDPATDPDVVVLVAPPITYPPVETPPERPMTDPIVDPVTEPNLNDLRIVFDGVDIKDPSYEVSEIPLIPQGDEFYDSIPVDVVNLDRFPLFEECIGASSKEEKQQCFVQELHRRIGRQLRVKQDPFNVGRVTMYVEFVVTLDGEFRVVDVFKSPSADIEMQVLDIMKKMPEVEPAISGGRHRAMKMVLPVTIVYN